MSLYDDLGVQPDADPDEIRDAYRRKAKQTHPDTGGSEEEMQAVNRAWMVLRDPARRKHYDETGQPDAAPDNSLSEMANIIGMYLQRVIQGDWQFTDLTDQIGRLMALDHATGIQAISGMKAEEEKLAAIAERFSFGGDGHDTVAIIMKDKARNISAQIRHAEAQLDLLERARTHIAEYGYRIDERPKPPSSQFSDSIWFGSGDSNLNTWV